MTPLLVDGDGEMVFDALASSVEHTELAQRPLSAGQIVNEQNASWTQKRTVLGLDCFIGDIVKLNWLSQELTVKLHSVVAVTGCHVIRRLGISEVFSYVLTLFTEAVDESKARVSSQTEADDMHRERLVVA